MNKLALKLSLVIALLPNFGGAVMAEERDAPKVFVQFSPEKGEYAGISLATELRQTDSLPVGEYRAKAKVVLTTEKTSDVVDSRVLEWREPAQPLEGVSGWQKREGAWIGMPPASLVLPFQVARDGGDRVVNLVDFDELWLDFGEAVPEESCRISMAVNVAAKSRKGGEEEGGIQELLLVSSSRETLSPMLSIDTARVNWKPRDNFYLAKREMGLGFDEDWRYTQDGKSAVIQRRFHQDIRNVEALDMLFAHGVAVDKVNIRVSGKGLPQSDELIVWEAMQKQIETIAEGTRVRLYLGGVVRARLAAAQKREGSAFLKEVVILIPGEAERVAAQRPLRGLVFQSMPGASPEGLAADISLPQRSETVSPGHRRLVIDLRPLVVKGWRGADIEKGIVILDPSDPMQYCGIKPTSLRLVALGEGQRPVPVGDVSRFGQALGGPFLMSPSEGVSLEWIESDAYLPFALLPVQAQEIGPANRELELAGWGLALQVSSTGKTKIEKESDGIVLTGVGGEVKLLWRRPVKLDGESRLMFRVPQGAEQIADAHAELEFDGGEKVSLGFVVNQALVLGSPERAGKTVRRMTIRLKMRETPFRLQSGDKSDDKSDDKLDAKLRYFLAERYKALNETSFRLKLGELLIFHPRLIQPGAVIHAPRPGLEFVPLVAADATAPEYALLTATDNRIHGVLPASDHPPDTLSWSTPVGQPAGALVALQFDHRMSMPVDEPCWLTVTLEGPGASVTRQLCPEGVQGKLVEPLAQLLGDLPPDTTVRSISWKVQLPAGRRQATSFDFQAHLGTVHAPSIADLLQKHALFRVGQHSYRPVALADEALKGLAQQGSAWLDLGPFDWEGGGVPIQLTDNHPYFRVTRVNLESSTAPTEEQWARLSGKDKHGGGDSPWPRRLLIFALLLLITAWARLRRDSLRRLRERGLSWIRAAWPPCRSIVAGLAGWVWRAALRCMPWANRAIGAFMLVPGLWLLGLMKSTPLTRGMVGFALVLAAGALWHELRWRYGSRREMAGSVTWWFGSPAGIPAFVLVLTAGATGWAAWSLGRGETYAALLPLVAAGYFYLPWLALIVRWVKSGNGATWAWAVLAMALYLLGLRYGVGRGENYFFTFGGLALALAGRAWLMSIRVRVEARWPLVAEKVYGGAGTVYFAGALIGLVLTALLMILKVEFLAEQVAVVVYYFLVAGVVLEILALRRESRREMTKGGETALRDTGL